MMEPAITVGSYLFYRFFHQEPFDLSVDPLSSVPLCSGEPYDANQAVPVLLASQARARLPGLCPSLALLKAEWLSYLAYPLSGGLRPWSLLSARAAGFTVCRGSHSRLARTAPGVSCHAGVRFPTLFRAWVGPDFAGATINTRQPVSLGFSPGAGSAAAGSGLTLRRMGVYRVALPDHVLGFAR